MFSTKLAEKSSFGVRVVSVIFFSTVKLRHFSGFSATGLDLSSKSKSAYFTNVFGHLWDLGVHLGYRMYAFLRANGPSGL